MSYSEEHAPPLYPREPWRALLEAEKPKVDQKQTGGPSTGVDTRGGPRAAVVGAKRGP